MKLTVPDYILTLKPYVAGKPLEELKREYGISDAIKLASNENPLPPLPSVLAAIGEAATGLNRYADHRATAVRERLAEWLDIDVGQVAVGCGSVGLLQQLALTYVDPGDEVVFPWRSFEVFIPSARTPTGYGYVLPVSKPSVGSARVSS